MGLMKQIAYVAWIIIAAGWVFLGWTYNKPELLGVGSIMACIVAMRAIE
jgi:hypothetical protein